MKIGIVGSGMVGATAAYALLIKGIGREIIIVDKNAKRAEAETFDLRHAVPFSNPLNINHGGYSDLSGAAIVIISAGVAQKPGETRLDLLKRNAAVFKEVVPGILKHAPQSILVVATNPADIMTDIAGYYAESQGVPRTRVLGTGTMLDTARFRSLLAGRMGVDPHHVHGYVLGEHGDSEVLAWSQVTVGGVRLEDYCRQQQICIDARDREIIDHDVRNAAYKIIEGKGATYYGIGAAITKLADVISHDQRSILTVSAPTTDLPYDGEVCLSLPRLVGGDGVLGTFRLSLTEKETRLLADSAATVDKARRSLDDFL